MNRNDLSVYFSIPVFIACVIVMQLHAIPFWSTLAGKTGIYISLVLEVVGIWLWISHNKIAGFITSVVLIAGPLAHIADPVLKNIKNQSIDEKILKMSKNINERNMKINENLTKNGWAGIAKDSLSEQRKLQARQQNLLNNQRIYKSTWERAFKLIIQMLGLLVMLWTQIKILKLLQIYYSPLNQVDETTRCYKNSTTQNSYNNEDLGSSCDDSDIEILEKNIMLFLEELKNHYDGTWATVAKKLEIPQSNISRLKNRLSNKNDQATDEMLYRLSEKIVAFSETDEIKELL